MSETFAIGLAGGKKVSIWCQGPLDNFNVLNGAWRGSFADGVVTVKETGSQTPGMKVLWRGVTEYKGDYNDAIRWIEAQL